MIGPEAPGDYYLDSGDPYSLEAVWRKNDTAWIDIGPEPRRCWHLHYWTSWQGGTWHDYEIWGNGTCGTPPPEWYGEGIWDQGEAVWFWDDAEDDVQ